MGEILESQATMLKRLGKPAPEGDVSKAYAQQVYHAKTWINAKGIPAISVSHRDLIETPEIVIPALLDFLGSGSSPEELLPIVIHRSTGRDPECAQSFLARHTPQYLFLGSR